MEKDLITAKLNKTQSPEKSEPEGSAVLEARASVAALFHHKQYIE